MTTSLNPTDYVPKVRCGIDRIAADTAKIPEGRYGMVTAAHARTLDGRASRDLLHAKGLLSDLFSPEHGLDGVAAAGAEVDHAEDGMTGLPVHSLYKHGGAGDLIDPEVMDRLDGLIYDLPDLGVRFYTYIATCLQMLDAAAEHGKPVYILDRPNPLGGEIIEGTILDEADYSFVGPYSLPIRYGLTIGELATLYVNEKALDVDLHVITCEGWTRDMDLLDTGQIFTIPSPNIPNAASVLLYPGTCLIEGTNLSEGRGTGRPFTWFGAPYMDQEELAAALATCEHPGLAIRPQGYVPTFSKNKDEHCKGVALEIVDPKKLRPVRFMVEAIAVMRELYPEDFAFITNFGSNASFIERLMGRDLPADWSPARFVRQEAEDRKRFADRVKPYLLYD